MRLRRLSLLRTTPSSTIEVVRHLAWINNRRCCRHAGSNASRKAVYTGRMRFIAGGGAKKGEGFHRENQTSAPRPHNRRRAALLAKVEDSSEATTAAARPARPDAG
ncbi:hypothetical protein EVAR_69575_1 [Eumeta japonica]|uniref:Uncharacterized protein n=1 Tax=Eumeta variegata TaxID=151549 RepID=A0A4C2ABE6_EUMVA|nr:hypothetical protein EVAR_69575_1 [Eumeta japonica]